MKTIMITLALVLGNTTGLTENLDYYRIVYQVMEVIVKFILGLS